MKRPLFNQLERRIMREGRSLFADRMKFHIACKRFEKELAKSIYPIIQYLAMDTKILDTIQRAIFVILALFLIFILFAPKH